MLFGMFPSFTQLKKDFIGIIPSSILPFLHFMLLFIAKIIFPFHGIHEQFHIGYCVWNVSLLNPARKDAISIIQSSLLAFLHYILVSIAEIYFRSIQKKLHMGYRVLNVSLLHPAHKDFIGIIPSTIPDFMGIILVFIFHFHGSHK